MRPFWPHPSHFPATGCCCCNGCRPNTPAEERREMALLISIGVWLGGMVAILLFLGFVKPLFEEPQPPPQAKSSMYPPFPAK